MKPSLASLVRIIVIVAASGTLDLPHSALAQSSTPARFRSGVNLVTLDVCVRDRSGAFLPALEPEDFLVVEERTPQRLTFFSSDSRVPMTAVVLIDHSSSMTGAKLERAKAAALTFLRQLGPGDEAEVMAFNRTTERIVPFGADIEAARGWLDAVRPIGGTALFDAMYVALRDLDRVAGQHEGRRLALVVLSDGEDFGSRLRFEDVQGEIERTGAVVYSISLRMDAAGAGLAPRHEFAQLANDSGGRVVAIMDLAALAPVYADIAAELRHMYRLAYESTAASDGSWRRVSVRVPGRDVRARTRAGYYALAPGSR